MSILIDEQTRVIVQGITGRDGSFHAEAMLAYGTKVVGGVTPGKGGRTVGTIPVFNTVGDAVTKTGAQCSVVFVPAVFAPDAIVYYRLRSGIRAKLEVVNLAAGTMAIALENPDPGPEMHDPDVYIPTQQSLMGSVTSQSQETMSKVMDLLNETNIALARVNTEVIGEISESLRGVNEFTDQATDSLDSAQRDLHLAVQDTRAGLQDFRELAVATTELARNVNEAVTEGFLPK